MGTGASLTASERVQRLQTAATCESEGSSGLPVLLAERQGVARGRARGRLAGCASERRRGRGGRRDGRGHRVAGGGPVAGGTGAGPEGGDLPATCGSAGPHPEEAAWEVPAVGHSVSPGPGGADGGDAGVIADLRSRPATRFVRPVSRVCWSGSPRQLSGFPCAALLRVEGGPAFWLALKSIPHGRAQQSPEGPEQSGGPAQRESFPIQK